MKKIISSKSMLIICIIGILLFFIAFLISSVMLCNAIIQRESAQIVVYAILSGWFMLFLTIFLFTANRLGCIVSIDRNTITRKGFIGGFKKVCKLEDIQKVSMIDMPKVGKMIVILDKNSTCGFDYIHKKSCICFEHNDKNMAILKSFWHGDIQNATLEIYTKYYGEILWKIKTKTS